MDVTGRMKSTGGSTKESKGKESCSGRQMKTSEVEEVARVVASCITRTRWRLRPPSRRRLETDILALYTCLRPVVMVDYGGKMPELQEHLCQLMQLAQQETSLLLPLKVMVIEDMVYIIHLRELIEHARSTTTRPLYVDLEENPLKILSQADKNAVLEELVLIQKLFPILIPVGEVGTHSVPDNGAFLLEMKSDFSEIRDDLLTGHCNNRIDSSPVLIDLSSCMKDTSVTIPTLTGWLLGYPVVYLFGKEHNPDVIHNLSTKRLNLYKIVVTRGRQAGKQQHSEELLMSFTVPYDLSMRGKAEPWAKGFLAHMLNKFERCKPAWASLRLEVEECCPQMVVL